MPTPTVIAHRGASREAPENTVAAFARALALGADGIELDTHLTWDRAVVVHHDPIPKPAADEPAIAWRQFTAMTLAEVKKLRVGGTHEIPTLPEVLEIVGARLTVYCELKGAGVVEVAAPILARHQGPCAVHSFDHRAVLRSAAIAPQVPRGILVDSRLVDTSHALEVAKASALWPFTAFVDADLVAEVHARGGQVIVWTPDDPLEITRLAALGVDGLCTNDVVGARRALQSTFGVPHA